MTTTAHDRTDRALAEAFVRAYCDVDEPLLWDVLAPDVRVRVLSPPGYEEMTGVQALIDELRAFRTRWELIELDRLEVELLAANRLQTGRIACVAHRHRLRSADGGGLATMVITHMIAISEGRIALVDELCSGIMPQAKAP